MKRPSGTNCGDQNAGRAAQLSARRRAAWPEALFAQPPVKTLEHNLGVQLFQRTTRSVSLTDAGEQLLQRLAPLLNQMDEVLHDVSLSRQQQYGTLRISASDVVIGLLLDQVVPEFSARYPGIQLDFAARARWWISPPPGLMPASG